MKYIKLFDPPAGRDVKNAKKKQMSSSQDRTGQVRLSEDTEDSRNQRIHTAASPIPPLSVESELLLFIRTNGCT